MNRFRDVTLVVTLVGIGLLESVGCASDFGLIHFYGSVLYSGCYVLGTQDRSAMIATHKVNKPGLNFAMKFKHCRLVDQGQVLAEVSVVHHDWNSLQVLQTNGHYQMIKPANVLDSVMRFPLHTLINTLTYIERDSLQFRYDQESSLTHRDIGLEIIYR